MKMIGEETNTYYAADKDNNLIVAGTAKKKVANLDINVSCPYCKNLNQFIVKNADKAIEKEDELIDLALKEYMEKNQISRGIRDETKVLEDCYLMHANKDDKSM